MARRSIRDIENIWSNVEGVKKLSDRVIGIGPFGMGLDAMLTWVPVVGTAYTVGTGGWLMLQAVRAKATPATLARMGAYMAIDTATGTVPIAGDIVDTFFPGQLMAARALQKHIESTHWVEDTEANARATGDHEMHEARVQNDKTLKRIIYLHD
ncbi:MULTISPECIES: DUF4112 domain-containing protein [Brevundimonas]|jgi:hypothetical protein|uniref:DUF4112 domain-containing protein n=3 Tax=Brevundimonas TaxID=41275 RepID=A0A1Z3UDK1_BREVE|nr:MULTISPECIES: DUF4112 domain-containing protein [Brevundimonas]ASE41064.1 DUF4112 domain-containing protein [Brevundimonas vesicularis]KQR56113.1 hypothetical protein ASF81_09100 [Brevundimonas sp. Leaf168]MDQ1192292.1 hypothetical protein [Brevundimonas vesicularis]MDX2333484.1 DUF4112 domain-containing protein [Brevundimonas vesicularis]MRL70386.1 DUF4112 domain-containing protein [Brevundimonas sp. SPF441]